MDIVNKISFSHSIASINPNFKTLLFDWLAIPNWIDFYTLIVIRWGKLTFKVDSYLINRQSISPFFRTDTLLEIFEDAPDDNANWGEVVDTEKKFYNTSSSSSSSDENGKNENNLDVKPVRSLTLRWFSVTRFDYNEA